MAMLRFTEADYAWVTERIKEVADKYAGGRIVSVLEEVTRSLRLGGASSRT